MLLVGLQGNGFLFGPIISGESPNHDEKHAHKEKGQPEHLRSSSREIETAGYYHLNHVKRRCDKRSGCEPKKDDYQAEECCEDWAHLFPCDFSMLLGGYFISF